MKFGKFLVAFLVVLIGTAVAFLYFNLKDVIRQKFEQKEKDGLAITLIDESFNYLAWRNSDPVLKDVEKKFYLRGFRLESSQGADGYELTTKIKTSPKNLKWAKRIQEFLGKAELEIDKDFPQTMIKVVLGIDQISQMKEEIGPSAGHLMLNASGREEISRRVVTLLNDKGLITTAVELPVKKKRTLIVIPPSLQDKAELAKKTLGVGMIKTQAELDKMVIYLGQDFMRRSPKAKSDQPGLETATETNPNLDAREAEEVVINPDYPYWAVIDKSDFELRLYSKDNELLKIYPMAYGMDEDGADKKSARDNRTPEGDFFICQVQNSSYWKFEGEDGAYGPYFLRLETTPWTGIGIHGTNDPESIGTKATHGCVRLHSEDLLAFKEYVDLGMPVRIQP